MSYRIYIYAIMLFVAAFALSGINFDNVFKKNHIIEAKIFTGLMIMAVAYLASNYIISFIESM